MTYLYPINQSINQSIPTVARSLLYALLLSPTPISLALGVNPHILGCVYSHSAPGPAYDHNSLALLVLTRIKSLFLSQSRNKNLYGCWRPYLPTLRTLSAPLGRLSTPTQLSIHLAKPPPLWQPLIRHEDDANGDLRPFFISIVLRLLIMGSRRDDHYYGSLLRIY